LVILEHYRSRRECSKAGVGEDRPLAALDVHLEQVGFCDPRQHVDCPHLDRSLIAGIVRYVRDGSTSGSERDV
jgi:hypothetical protein